MLQGSSWDVLIDRAKSKHPLDQVAALIHAAAKVELALTAVDIPIQNARGNWLSLKQRLSQARAADPIKWPPESDLREAVRARNVAAHDLQSLITTRKRYSSHVCVGLFFQAWKILRGIFVTKQHAADLAARFLHLPPFAQWDDPSEDDFDDASEDDFSEFDPLTQDNIEAVYLFGSLARGNTEPGDIDLLIVDRGGLSLLIDPYDTVETGRDLLIGALDNRNFFTAAERAAAASGWLDIVALNGKKFEDHFQYRRAMFNWQADPLFFLNIASDLLIYSEEKRQWHVDRPGLFDQLARIRQYLDQVGVPRGRQEREINKPPTLFDTDEV